ncbi:Flagellar hook protein FlgE [Halanaerobium saccharolyticum subsp. saccharolyticum DSM 6643]|uniref:Flagellar hook protein FlgE n=1 Tax=Halanaerobium saccharolyticum subsp. saccharolyticum DSM 6643 TaxID=1293054 RepID=M5E2M7_9FIRM|nr:flagellar hook protein FlgE [Halanaerobium saccharolyticum]CCU80780.1 Flagellar hook protein FlgE [Halanaerobium saccharolyticum subsp. saccharolyticum DSM 6643]
MLRSMYAGVSGLNTHQQMMDVTGNNISNVNTIGFKSSRVTFKEMLSQTLKGASRPSDNGDRAGTNPQQIGLGVGIGSIDSDMSSGNLQSTGKNSDVAIQGDGFFVLQDENGNKSYSRAGNFGFDAKGNLFSLSTGLQVVGAVNELDNNQENNPINLKSTINAKSTDEVSLGGNLNKSITSGEERTVSTDIIAQDNSSYTLEMTYTKDTADDEWTGKGKIIAEDKTETELEFSGSTPVNEFDISFLPNGDIQSGEFQYTDNIASIIGNDIEIDLNNLTQISANSDINFSDVTGYKKGDLESFSFDENGYITGSYSNGLSEASARIKLVNFSNPAGLNRKDGVFTESVNSGEPQNTFPGSGGTGNLAPSTLEMSNANLSQEFTNMITAQRGFQASSKLITTSDEMLQELVNLKR